MNYDLDTEAGMQNSVDWLTAHLARIATGGVWAIPRSGTAYTIRHEDKVAVKIMRQGLDPALDKVFRAAGWKVVDNT